MLKGQSHSRQLACYLLVHLAQSAAQLRKWCSQSPNSWAGPLQCLGLHCNKHVTINCEGCKITTRLSPGYRQVTIRLPQGCLQGYHTRKLSSSTAALQQAGLVLVPSVVCLSLLELHCSKQNASCHISVCHATAQLGQAIKQHCWLVRCNNQYAYHMT